MTTPATTAELLVPWFAGAATISKARAHKALGIGRDQLDALIEAGEIAYTRAGTRQRFTLEQLIQWLDRAATLAPSVVDNTGGRKPCRSRNAAGSGITSSDAAVYDFEALRARRRGAQPKPPSGGKSPA